MTHRLDGIWKKGLAFDLHTLASDYLGPDEQGRPKWDTTRSEMGDLVYRLKYQGDKAAIDRIVALLDRIRGIEKFDAIIPVPSSNRSRPYQPVEKIAKALGGRRKVPVLAGFLKKRMTGRELKQIDDPSERERLLEGAITIAGQTDISGRNVLVVDDLYRSGATLSAATKVLYATGKAASVSVLTMTKTRTKR